MWQILVSASRRSSGSGSAAGHDLSAYLDLDGAVAAGGAGEFLYAPAILVLHVVAKCHCGEHDRQVGLGGFAGVSDFGRCFTARAIRCWARWAASFCEARGALSCFGAPSRRRWLFPRRRAGPPILQP